MSELMKIFQAVVVVNKHTREFYYIDQIFEHLEQAQAYVDAVSTFLSGDEEFVISTVAMGGIVL